MATSIVRPSPSERTTEGVGAPGRCRLASARRRPGRFGRGSRRAVATTRAPAARNTAKLPAAPQTNRKAIQRSLAVKMAIAASRPTPSTTASQARAPGAGGFRRQEGAEQAGGRDPPGPRQRQPGESGGHQQAEQAGQDQGLRVEARRRLPAETVAQHPDHRRRRAGAEQQADHDPDQGDHGDLDEIDLKDLASGGAQALEGGDGRQLAVEIAFDRVHHPEAADQQGGEADQAQIEREPVDEAPDAGRRRAGIAHPPAGIGKGGRQVAAQRLDIAARR